MTGPEHYREAGAMLSTASSGIGLPDVQAQGVAAAIARAHATLALVALQVQRDNDIGFSEFGVPTAWGEAVYGA